MLISLLFPWLCFEIYLFWTWWNKSWCRWRRISLRNCATWSTTNCTWEQQSLSTMRPLARLSSSMRIQGLVYLIYFLVFCFVFVCLSLTRSSCQLHEYSVFFNFPIFFCCICLRPCFSFSLSSCRAPRGDKVCYLSFFAYLFAFDVCLILILILSLICFQHLNYPFWNWKT